MLLPSKRMSAKGESWFLSNWDGKTTFTLTATTPNWPSSVSYNIIAGSKKKKRFPLRAIVLLLFYTSARPISCCVGSGPKWCSSSLGRPDFWNKNEFLFSIPERERENKKQKCWSCPVTFTMLSTHSWWRRHLYNLQTRIVKNHVSHVLIVIMSTFVINQNYNLMAPHL